MFLRSMMDKSQTVAVADPVVDASSRRRRRRKSVYSKAMSKELKALNARYKTKKGEYRKGFDAGRIMKMAHKNVRRNMK